MAAPDIARQARSLYAAFVERDRPAMEALLAPDFTFTSPYDDHIDRAAYFERCWPNNGRIKGIDVLTVAVEGSQAFVLYEVETAERGTFRNTEVLWFEAGEVRAVEVYFGELNDVVRKP